MTTIACPHCHGLVRVVTPTPTAFTRRQLECLVFIRDYMAANCIAPSFENIKQGLRLGSKAEVARLVTALEERGAITRMHRRARALEISRAALAAIANETPFFKRPGAKIGPSATLDHVSLMGASR